MRGFRGLLATLLLTAALLVPGLLVPSRASAAAPEALVSIQLDSFSPSLPQRGSTITVTGTVTNTSDKRVERPRAYFWRDQAPITDDEGFQQALDSAANSPTGARKIADGSYQELYVEDRPYLEPGASTPFRLTVSVHDLDLSPTPGIYLMGVHVLADDTPPAIGRARVFVPVLTAAPRNTLQLTSVVALNSRPSLLRTENGRGVFVDDHLADEIGPGGRLQALLTAADSTAVSFAVDPELVQALQAMRGGYSVVSGDGVQDGRGRVAAGRWLDTFARLLRQHDGFQLLYGSPDVAALVHGGQTGVLRSAQAAARRVELTAGLPLLVWPGAGAADAATLAAAQALRPAAVLLSDGATRSEAPLLQGRSAPVVSYTSAAFGGGPGPDPSEDAVHIQQRLLAESWLQTSTRPAGSTLGHVRVIGTAAQARSDGAAVAAPWIRQTTLSQLLRSTPVVWSQQPRYPESSRAKELDAAQLADLQQLSTGWASWRDLLVDPAAATVSADAAVARAASVRRRGADRSLRAYLAPQLSQLEDRLAAVQISVTRRVLTPRTQVRFPITIVNRLPASEDPDDTTTNAVRVRLDFTSDNSQRLSVAPIVSAVIQPGQNYQGEAVVDARTNGTVQVTAQLHTISGRSVGRPRTIEVTATQAGTAGWFIALGAGVVLVGLTALRIRQVTRERARQAARTGTDASPDQLDATRSAPAQPPTPTQPPAPPAGIDV